jgi:hypothetical protein
MVICISGLFSESREYHSSIFAGEAGFPVDEAIAPICYRILFANGEPSSDYVNELLVRFAV